LLRGIAEELEAGIRGVVDDSEPNLLSYHVISLTPQRARQLEERLRSLIAEYERASSATSRARRFGLLGALVPLQDRSRP